MTEESGAVVQNGSSNCLTEHSSQFTRGKATVVLGAQWGDEGKGKLVDLLVSENDGVNVCRCQVSF